MRPLTTATGKQGDACRGGGRGRRTLKNASTSAALASDAKHAVADLRMRARRNCPEENILKMASHSSCREGSIQWQRPGSHAGRPRRRGFRLRGSMFMLACMLDVGSGATVLGPRSNPPGCTATRPPSRGGSRRVFRTRRTRPARARSLGGEGAGVSERTQWTPEGPAFQRCKAASHRGAPSVDILRRRWTSAGSRAKPSARSARIFSSAMAAPFITSRIWSNSV
jgi:hypothetical protein